MLGSSVLLSVFSVQGALLCALFCDCCCGPSPLWVQCCVLCHACSALGAVLLFYSFVSMRDGSLCAGCDAVSRQCVEHLSLALSCRLPPPPSKSHRNLVDCCVVHLYSARLVDDS